MNHITLTRTAQDLTVNTEAGELGFILGRPGDFEAWANLEPANGFGRAAVQAFKSLRDAVAFITVEGVAL
ncbi:MAG: hypothetical protein M3511_13670 [Deinococcota bacterium]|jgi:hypothetical protein|nr:hypothetical protein [Deinococcota bacterium]